MNNGLSNIGFLFGAGTSLYAGYPLSRNLTVKVIEALTDSEKEILQNILTRENLSIENQEEIPDIEKISDIIFKYSLSNDNQELKELENSVRDAIINIIKSVNEPNLDLHIKFFKSLKSIIGPKARCIYIFTTNYDLSIEKAALYAKIPIFNGFAGTTFRFFDAERFKLTYGQIINRKFYEFAEPYIKLIKLHGSISWVKNGNSIFELGDLSAIKPSQSSIILPKTQKIRDTLDYPYNHLFSYASRIIGSSQCRYLVSCGCSLRDEHINDHILIPKLRANKIRLFATFKHAPTTIDQFQQFSSFNYLTETNNYIRGNLENGPSNLWDFNQFVNELAEKAGIE